ncbi:MAG: hypothetical protein M5U32_01385 [Myxococcota bacterium]|nr:hypothetical protein [Myxococcota bacterium]
MPSPDSLTRIVRGSSSSASTTSPPARWWSLAAATERAARAAGFAPETRPFHGHLTLGRRRSSRRPLRLPDGECAEPAPFSADAVVLFRSQRSAAGATYTPLERIALGGVASP